MGLFYVVKWVKASIFSTENTYMIVRVGFLVAASIAAYAVKQINVKPSKPSSDSLPKNSGDFLD